MKHLKQSKSMEHELLFFYRDLRHLEASELPSNLKIVFSYVTVDI